MKNFTFVDMHPHIYQLDLLKLKILLSLLYIALKKQKVTVSIENGCVK
jgi:hypothetical protein